MTPVARRFGRAAARYEQHAAMQRIVSERLLASVRQKFPIAPRRVLEVGCGTGLLSRPLRRLWPQAEIVFCDLAPPMVMMCRQTLARAGAEAEGQSFSPERSHFIVCDGQALPFTTPFDLIISSMTAQWFHDSAATLAEWRRLLAPGGCLAVALPVAGSLGAWEAALTGLGLPSGLQPFPAAEALLTVLAPIRAAVYEIVASYPQGLDFLRDLKGIGGETPRAGYQPLSPAQLRQAMAAFTATGGRVTWRIAEVLVQAD